MYKRVLVALDGSELSCKVLGHAADIAEKFGSELTLLTIVSWTITNFSQEDSFDPNTAIAYIENRDRIKKIHYDILTEAEARVRSEHPDLNVSTTLREGHPSATIVDVAEKEGYDLIVIGSRGIRGITGLILGSTSRGVVDSCKKPVLIIKTS